MPPSPAVWCRGLTKRFGRFTAVAGLTFEVEQGEVFGFLGPNGAGKSTTIRMLCGLLLPSEGAGEVAGLDVVRQAEAIKSRIGYMSQRFSLYGTLTVQENLEFYGGVYGLEGSALVRRIGAVMERLDLGHVRPHLARTLSAGIRQRLALGCAILHEPRILFLDEPTSGVDPLTRRRFFELIGDLRAQGVTVFVTTHVMDEAELCTRVALIRRRLIALGTPSELKRRVGGSFFRVRADHPGLAFEALQQRPDVADVSLVGGALHVRLRDSSADPKRWATELPEAGITDVEPAEPTIESVFLALMDPADEDEAW